VLELALVRVRSAPIISRFDQNYVPIGELLAAVLALERVLLGVHRSNVRVEIVPRAESRVALTASMRLFVQMRAHMSILTKSDAI